MQSDLVEQHTVLLEHDDKLTDALEQLGNVMKKSEISPFLLDFNKPEDQREFVFLNGQLALADIAYMDIYKEAKQSIHIADNYISLKALYLLGEVRPLITINMLSDNVGRRLRLLEYRDFITEYPEFSISFHTTRDASHDRYIIIDMDTENEKVYHSGASSKDAGSRTASISQHTHPYVFEAIRNVVKDCLHNPELVLD